MGMSLTQLNELLKRAIDSLQDERATLVTFVDPTKPLLPESYWRDQHAKAVAAAAATTSELFDRSLEIVHARDKRRREDEVLANMSVDELLDDVGGLWEPDPCMSWGLTPMKRSGGVLKAPTTGTQQPAYNWECYQCGRPITDSGKDHGGRFRCDGALVDFGVPYSNYHTPKPWHGEEEDDEDEE
jgi:hypothetical protein